MNPVAEGQQKNKPDDTAFKQQRIAAWQPVMSPRWAITFLAAIGIAFIAIGAVVVVSSDAVDVVEVRYDQERSCPYGSRVIPDVSATPRDAVAGPGRQYWACDVSRLTFTLTKKMTAPIYMYYKLQNMNQNHRTYARSQNVLQLAGQTIGSADAPDCAPILTVGSFNPIKGPPMANFTNPAVGPDRDVSTAIYSPCGLIAWSMFNDSFVLSSQIGGNLTLVCETADYRADGTPTLPRGNCTKSGIAWPSDPDVKFKAATSVDGAVLTSTGWAVDDTSRSLQSYATYLSRGWYVGEPGHRIPDPSDEDLMVWMRLALLADFQKLHRVINVDLQPGSYVMEIYQRYDVSSFGGKKSFVLQTKSWLGGPNYWLGGLYLAVGSVCCVLSVAFLVKHLTTPQLLSF